MSSDSSFLSKEWLAGHTLPQTLERGEAYYQKGRIISVVQRGDVIEGKVQGSRKYIQTISVDESGEVVATCNCPYNSSGYCKHIVAVAMAVIDGHVQVADSPDNKKRIQVQNESFLEDEFLTAPEGLREAFLIQAFGKRNEWREAFRKFKGGPAEQHLVDLKEVRERIRDALLEMEISAQEVEVHTGKKGSESEVAEAFLRRKLFGLFKPHVSHLKRRIALGDLLNAHRIWIGMYEAISGLDHPTHSDIILPDEYPSYLKWEWSQATIQLLAAVSKEVIGPALVKQLVSLLTDRWSYFESGADTRKPPISISEADFEPWLILMAADPISATFVKHRAEAFAWKLPRLEARIKAILG